MAHMVESMAFIGQLPWHGLGTKLDAPPTVEAGLRAAGLDWRVGLKSLQTSDGQVVTHKATYRESDGKILGVVGPSYHPLQNAEAFAWFQPLLTTGEVELHTAGSLDGGKKVWVLGRINRPASEIVPGDVVEKYVLLSNSHDGSRAVRVGFTPIRVVCNNTLSLAHGDQASKLIRCLHFGNVVKTLDQIREVMNTANSEFEATAEQFRLLARRKVNRKDLEKYVRIVFGFDADEEVKPVTQTIFNAVLDLIANGRGNSLPGVDGTLWAAYNGVTEYLTYSRGKTQDNRLDSLWFGDSAQVSRVALEAAIAMAL